MTNQLATAAYGGHVANGSPNDASRTVTYTYTPDKLNRSSKTEVGGPSSGVTNYSPNALNQDTDTPGHSYSYDSKFNLTRTEGFNGWYDATNHLVSASNAGALDAQPTVAEFVYDGLGRCVKRTLNGLATVFVFDGWKPIGEFDQWGASIGVASKHLTFGGSQRDARRRRIHRVARCRGVRRGERLTDRRRPGRR